LTSLYSKIADEIQMKIDTGEFSEGDMLPKETELCEQYNVSRPTVRAALMQLVNLGMLKRIKGKGTFVKKTQIVLENSSLFIESFNEEHMKRMKTEVLEFRTVPSEETIADKLQIECGEPVTKLVRLRYLKEEFDSGPIVFTTSHFINDVSFIQQYNLEDETVDMVFKHHGVHRDIVEKEIKTEYLDAKKSRMLGVEEGTLALLIIAIVWDKDGRITEYAESSYPADRNRFLIRVKL